MRIINWTIIFSSLIVQMLEEQRGNHKAALKYATDALDWSRRLGMVQEQAQAEAIFQRVAKKDA